MNPKRVQLSRKRGWRMPPNTVKVDRSTKWGNPFMIGNPHPVHGTPITRKDAYNLFQSLVTGSGRKIQFVCNDPEYPVKDIEHELRGRNLACWCALNELCHADILLEAANS